MSRPFWPKKPLGKAAVIFMLLFVVLILLRGLSILRMPLPVRAIDALGIIGFVLGLISAAYHKDRSILTFAAIVIGALIILIIAVQSFIF